MGKRDGVLAELAGAILAVDRPHPVRVALDGCSAAGKTTMADELADVLRDRTDRDILRIGIDAFTRPAERRTAYPYDSPESYYLDTWDIEAIRDQVLVPLGPGGERQYALEPSGVRQPAAPDAVLLADGIFLQRPELITHWDLRIYVHISFDEVLRRGIVRDQYRMTSLTEAERRYRTKYIPGERLYVDQINPQARAHVVVTNEDPAHPTIELHNC